MNASSSDARLGVISMERYSEVVGLPVICVENGKKVGVIQDMIFCPQYREVKAFLLERQGYQIRKKVVLLKDVLNLGRDALIINDNKSVTALNKVEKTEIYRNQGEIKGLKVYTKNGNDLGMVKDILFDYKTGFIEGVEVSDGFLQDIVLGRKLVPLFGRVEFSKESLLVDQEALDEMTTTGGGLKNILEKE